MALLAQVSVSGDPPVAILPGYCQVNAHVKHSDQLLKIGWKIMTSSNKDGWKYRILSNRSFLSSESNSRCSQFRNDLENI